MFLKWQVSVVDGMGKICKEAVTADFMVLVIGQLYTLAVVSGSSAVQDGNNSLQNCTKKIKETNSWNSE